MGLTSDPTDPRIARGPPDTEPRPQEEMYLVLSEEERPRTIFPRLPTMPSS